eukprot:CAMPEP_0178956280 /NCGR_PEP_ID=MMETSP0789-20121207/10137_1 /TAXON_ID=3005 /ORGANISM="Rhizosolenia setigera, Strain CCMP 1694" /LENGTH=516 /DNA_ID=CAMNT_0020638133 /DNA_START=96 /DNA_END=1646 /DNA_ORIENTATION=+
MTATEEEKKNEDVTAHDLTSTISPYLDLHMMFPLLEYVDSSGLYSTREVAQARLSLLRPTHMVDYAMDIYRSLENTEDVPKEMEEQKEKVFVKLEELRGGCQAFDELWRLDGKKQELMQSGHWNLKGLEAKANISSDVIENYRLLAKFNYDCGDYQTARDMLQCYLSLFASPPSNSDDNADQEDGDTSKDDKQNKKNDKTGNPSMYYLRSVNKDLLQVLWGRLSCEILLENWDEANIALTAVRTAIELLCSSSNDDKLTALEALKERTWLLHWSLFVFWNDSSKGLENMVSLFCQERYLQVVTTNAPHLLRYLTAAVLLVKRRISKSSGSSQGSSTGVEGRRLIKDLVKIMNHCEYTDPIVDFVDCLCVKFDFDLAQSKLSECESVLMHDFFLCKQTSLFMEEARIFVFENYCRIHDKIDLKTLGEKLHMDQELAERWIVDLIRNASGLSDSAKIDSTEKCVIMGGEPQSVYEQVMEKTANLNMRSGTLVNNLNNLLNDARKEKAKKARAALEEEY